MTGEDGGRGMGLDDLALVSVMVLMLIAAGVAGVFYLAPPAHLRIPELDPTVRVGRQADFPEQGSRVVHWGEEVILVINPAPDEYVALGAVSPRDGCILQWDPASFRVVSPCSYEVYSLRGDVVAGLTRTPLRQYRVMLREGALFVVG